MSKLAGLFLGLVCLVTAGVAAAGYKTYSPIQVNTASRMAWGEIGATRNSADSNAYFDCQIQTHTTSGAYNVMCWGADAAGTSFSCSSTSANIIAAARTISGDDYVALYWDASAVCTALSVRKASSSAPKAN